MLYIYLSVFANALRLLVFAFIIFLNSFCIIVVVIPGYFRLCLLSCASECVPVQGVRERGRVGERGNDEIGK